MNKCWDKQLKKGGIHSIKLQRRWACILYIQWIDMVVNFFHILKHEIYANMHQRSSNKQRNAEIYIPSSLLKSPQHIPHQTSKSLLFFWNSFVFISCWLLFELDWGQTGYFLIWIDWFAWKWDCGRINCGTNALRGHWLSWWNEILFSLHWNLSFSKLSPPSSSLMVSLPTTNSMIWISPLYCSKLQRRSACTLYFQEIDVVVDFLSYIQHKFYANQHWLLTYHLESQRWTASKRGNYPVSCVKLQRRWACTLYIQWIDVVVDFFISNISSMQISTDCHCIINNHRYKQFQRGRICHFLA